MIATEFQTQRQAPRPATFVQPCDQTARNWESLARQAQYRPARLAQLCGISLRTLQRQFNQVHGLAAGTWLRNLRLHDAYDGIRAGRRVKEVAYDLGYKQLSHFSREFKRSYGVPPSFFSLELRAELWRPARGAGIPPPA